MYASMHTQTIEEKRGHDFEGEWREHKQGFGGRTTKGAMLRLNYNLKNTERQPSSDGTRL